MTRCPVVGCGGVLLAEPEELPLNYRGASTRRAKGWVFRCLSCGREGCEAGEVEQTLPLVAERRLKW